MELYNVFVYGTLKEGFPNFNKNVGARLDCDFITKASYVLYLVGERYSPWLIADAQNGTQIKGQVFTVDKQGLLAMDQLERINQEDGYQRVQIEVINTTNKSQLSVYVYLKRPSQLLAVKVKSALLVEYRKADATKYCSRS